MRNLLLLTASLNVLVFACSSSNDGGQQGAGGSGGSGGSATGGSGGSGGSAGGGSGGAGGGAGARADAGGGDRSEAGGARDGGGADRGGSGDTGAAAGPVASGCVGVMAAFCDDFEAQAAGQAPKGAFMVRNGGGATFAIDASKAFSGSKSAHIHVPRGAGGNDDPTAQMVFSSQFPVAMNDLHGRAMVFLTKNPNSTGRPNIHWDLLTASGGGKTYTLGSMWNPRAMGGAFMPVYQPGDRSIDTSTPFPEGLWACIQWQFRFGGAGGDLLEIKMNDKVVDLGKTTAEGAAIMGSHIPAWPAGPWARLAFGYVHFSSPTPIDVDLWFDDLAFGPQEIPCPAAK